MGQCGSVEGPLAGPSEHLIALKLGTKKKGQFLAETLPSFQIWLSYLSYYCLNLMPEHDVVFLLNRGIDLIPSCR